MEPRRDLGSCARGRDRSSQVSRRLKVLCPEANAERAVLDLEAVLDTAQPGGVVLRTTVSSESDGSTATEEDHDHILAAGSNTVRWRLGIERPELWWPRALGGQALHDVRLDVGPIGAGAGRSGDHGRAGRSGRYVPGGGVPGDVEPSDTETVRTGIRQVRLRNFVATVNGERLYLKGVNVGPTRRALAEASADDIARDVQLAADAGFDLIRVHAHISRPELYDAADRLGLLDPPAATRATVRSAARPCHRREAVKLLGHHPSIALWCGHNEPMAPAAAPGEARAQRSVARSVAAQILPTWNKTALDGSIRRALEQADGSRAVVTHSAVLPHPAWGTDSHFYFGWYHGEERDLPATLARLPVLARFVGEFGTQSVPNSADFMGPENWPDLDLEHLEAHHCYQRAIFEQEDPTLGIFHLRRLAPSDPGLPVDRAAPSHRNPPPPQVPSDGRLLRLPARRRPARGELLARRPRAGP